MNRLRLLVLAVLGSALLALGNPMAHADDDFDDDIPVIPIIPLISNSSITGQFLSESEGAFGFNEASGVQNLQFNNTAVAISSGGLAIANVEGFQLATPVVLEGPLEANAIIDGQAFSDIEGIISVNQAAGGGNLQGNSIAIAVGNDPVIVADNLLSQLQSSPPAIPTGDDDDDGGGVPSFEDKLSATIGGQAFSGAAGVVQLNQAAGVNNASRNLFALRVAAGVNP